jgi:plasmid stabilization system protein ParE
LRVGFARLAARDLDAAIQFLAQRDPRTAARLIDDVIDLGQRLADGGFDGVEVRLKSGLVVRSWPLPPYRIYYRRQPNLLEIMRVYHQARRPIAE